MLAISIFVYSLFTPPSAAASLQGDSLLTTSVNGNVYDLTVNGSTSTWPPIPAEEVDLNVKITFGQPVLRITYSSMELLYPDSLLADLIYINTQPQTNFSGSKYNIPGNLPSNDYSVRINLTYSSSTGSQGETITLSPFEIAPALACSDLPVYGGAHPISDSSYSSLHIITPSAGANLQVVAETTNPEYSIQWDYYDATNAHAHGISDIVMEFVQKSNDATGYRFAGAFTVNSSALSANYPYSGGSVDFPGLWYIRVNYTNSYQNNPNDINMTYFSEPFIVSHYNEGNPTCLAMCLDVGPHQDCSFLSSGEVFGVILPKSSSFLITLASFVGLALFQI
ncbi:hypothetical protein FRB95_009682 [Tulasnella sp. JGI-2019a]|nr:hypothetical protein FRB95_009682 [Tulasnella sp. JGI-2019a]